MDGELLGSASQVSGRGENNLNIPQPSNRSALGGGKSNTHRSKKSTSEDSNEEDDKFEESENAEKDDEANFPLFSETSKLFQFRSTLKVGKKNTKQGRHLVKKGQYEFPFTFTIPSGNPSSFQFIDNNDMNYQVKYEVNVEFKGGMLSCKKEIKVVQEKSSLVDISNTQSYSSKLNGPRGIMGLFNLDFISYMPSFLLYQKQESNFYLGNSEKLSTASVTQVGNESPNPKIPKGSQNQEQLHKS